MVRLSTKMANMLHDKGYPLWSSKMGWSWRDTTGVERFAFPPPEWCDAKNKLEGNIGKTLFDAGEALGTASKH